MHMATDSCLFPTLVHPCASPAQWRWSCFYLSRNSCWVGHKDSIHRSTTLPPSLLSGAAHSSPQNQGILQSFQLSTPLVLGIPTVLLSLCLLTLSLSLPCSRRAWILQQKRWICQAAEAFCRYNGSERTFLKLAYQSNRTRKMIYFPTPLVTIIMTYGITVSRSSRIKWSNKEQQFSKRRWRRRGVG